MRLFRRNPTKTPPPPTPAARAAQERDEHAAWLAAAAAETARVRAIAERDGVYFPSDDGRGATEPIDLRDGEVWLDAFGRVRRPSNLGRWLGRE